MVWNIQSETKSVTSWDDEQRPWFETKSDNTCCVVDLFGPSSDYGRLNEAPTVNAKNYQAFASVFASLLEQMTVMISNLEPENLTLL